MILYQNIWWWPRVYNELNEYEQKVKFKNTWGHEIYVQKPNLAIFFWGFLIVKSFEFDMLHLST